MTTIAQVSIPVSDFALSHTLKQHPDIDLRIENVAGEGPLQVMPLVWFADVDIDELESTLADDETVDEYIRLLEDLDAEEWFYRITYAEDVTCVCRCIFEHDGAILDAQVSGRRWILRLLFPQRELLSNSIEAIEQQEITIDVRRIVKAGRNGDFEGAPALTDPQEEAITEAYRQGYYDVPREISLEELAAELDISHQALSERLRRANKVLAGEQVEEPTTKAIDG